MKVSLRNGPATVTLSHDLAGMARRVVEGAQRGAGRLLLQDAEAVRSEASALWYQQVRKRTGQSGRIETALEIREDRVLVKVGSTDSRVGKGGKPAVVYVHRPGALSVTTRPATAEEYHKRRSQGMDTKEAYWIAIPNPLAGDGKFLLPELVKTPFRRRVKSSIKLVAKEITNG